MYHEYLDPNMPTSKEARDDFMTTGSGCFGYFIFGVSFVRLGRVMSESCTTHFSQYELYEICEKWNSYE